MKQIKYLVLFALIVLIAGCGGKKMKAPVGETEINVPCSGEEFWGVRDFFRANAVGESSDQSTSKKKALSNARADLASSVNTTIKGTIDNYINSREFNNVEDVEERFEGLTREVINQELNSVKVICEKLFRTSEGDYKTYIAIEMSAESLLSAMDRNLAKEETLRVDYDYEKFKEEFYKEMNKLGDEY